MKEYAVLTSVNKRLALAPLLAGTLIAALAGCSGTATATATVTVTATPKATPSTNKAADLPNDHSSPDALAVSLFRDILNKDAPKFLDLFGKELQTNYKDGITRSVALADVSKYSNFTVTNVKPGWSGNDTTTAAAVYYTVMHDRQQLQGELKAELDDPNYAPNNWTIGNYAIPSGYNNQVFDGDAGVKEIPITLSGNGKQIDLSGEGDAGSIFLFPGDYTVTGKLNASKNATVTTNTFTLNALQRP